MESFSSYAFNKSHAASYATISYQTAYLKCHYPKYYMAALLTSVLDNQNKMAVYIEECNRIGIKVLPPSVNYSSQGFTVVDDHIRFGLMAIKNLGKNIIDEIVAERKKNDFKSFYDFCKRLYGKNMNSRGIESLIKSGALDNLGANRRQMLSVYKNILDNLEYDRRKNVEGQLSFFDIGESESETKTVDIPNIAEFPISELLSMEKEIAGMYLSGHPLYEYDNYINLIKADKIGEIISNDNGFYRDGQQIRLFVIINKIKNQVTKSNQMMSFVTVEDKSGSIETIIFPKTLAEYGNYIYEGNIIEVVGTVNIRENEDPKVVVNQICPAPPKDKIPTTVSKSKQEYKTNPVEKIGNRPVVKPDKLYLKIPDRKGEKYKKVKNLLEIFSGSTMVMFFVEDENKLYKAPRQLWADVNDVFISELKYILGKENVVFR